MDGMQLNLFDTEHPTTETPKGVEPCIAVRAPENRAVEGALMEQICERGNMIEAYKRVVQNKGGPGIDGMRVEQLRDYLREHWGEMKDQLLKGVYKPLPVKGVDIPKASGGVRKLGIPVVVDRLICQAVLRVIQPIWEPQFSDNSYGFRPGRSQHQAVERAKQHVAQGYGVVVDIDLEKFFDRVNHDRLMSALAEKIKDKRLLKLIRGYLTAGIMDNGLTCPRMEGTPQGSPLSPLLSNIVLDELDKELGRRKLRFVRYADDCNIYVKSERAGRRIMRSITAYLKRRLKLTVNAKKSKVDITGNCSFLGFTITNDSGAPRTRVSDKSIERFKERVVVSTRRVGGKSVETVAEQLSSYLRGWHGYYRVSETKLIFGSLDGWIRRRLRALIWKQWNTPRNRVKQLRKRGIGLNAARKEGNSRKGAWKMSHARAVQVALPNVYFKSLGLYALDS